MRFLGVSLLVCLVAMAGSSPILAKNRRHGGILAWLAFLAASFLATAVHPYGIRPLTTAITVFSRSVFSWLLGVSYGVPTLSGDRAETLLLDLVRAGIENDFERVVFPQYPELREVKRVLEREGAKYASLSGSGSALYGIFETADSAEQAAAALKAKGIAARATTTLGRQQYWKRVFGD